MNRMLQFTFLVLCLACVAAPVLHNPAGRINAATSFPGWPEKWEGHWLEPLPLTEQETAFADAFPGRLGVFAAGPDKVIFRWVTRPTRKLHSSADCLRASGFVIESGRPGRFIAHGPRGGFLVTEKIRAGSGKTWDEVSAWFWSAALGRTEGPWWAVTVIHPLES